MPETHADVPPFDRPDLRERAMQRLRRRRPDVSELTREDIERAVYELEVHQVELEVQNEELRRVQKELLEARDRYLDLYEFAPVGYLTLDQQGVIVRANLAGATLSGEERGALIGRRFERAVALEDRDACYLLLREASAAGAGQREFRLARRNGETIWVHAGIVAWPTAAEQAAGFAVTLTDITARKRAEDELRRANERLEECVAERTSELREKTQRLRRLAGDLAAAEQRERRRLAALLHDELQQLLVAARMRLAAAHGRIENKTVVELVQSTNELLEMAIAASRDLTRQLRPPVLYEDGLLPALHWLADEMSSRHHLAVQIDANIKRLPLNDDVRAQIFECVRELLFNVVKHARVGLAVVRVRQKGGRLRIAVEDEGVGFDVTAAFNMASDKGIGLFSIRERLLALGGELTAQSRRERGTRVTMELPLAEPDQPAEGEPESAESPQAQPETRPIEHDLDYISVLVVDDHPIVREGIANLLEFEKRIRVVGEASDGAEAINGVMEHQPNVVLMDVNMPNLNGVEATREIRRRWPWVAVVALSVQDDEATARSMLDAGAASFVSKSEDCDRMVAAIVQAASLAGSAS